LHPLYLPLALFFGICLTFIFRLSNKIIMSAGKYLKVIWMYAIGLALVFIGLYMISFMPSLASSGPYGFGLMVTGLLLSTVGGIYGKKKLLETSGEKLPAVETKQIDQLKQNVVSQLKPPETSAEAPASLPKIVEQPALEPSHMPDTGQIMAPKVALAPPSQYQPGQPAQVQPTAPVTDGVVKVLLCPGCNMENPPSNAFCFNCGKRLRAPEKKAGKAKPRKKARKRAKPAVPA
jgi:hypothetical protein